MTSSARASLEEGGPRGTLEVELCDLAVLAEVRALAARILARHPRVDVLVNNAGVMLDRRVTTVEGHEAAFATNVLAGWLLTALVTPAMAAGGRVIHVTSGGMYTQRLDRRKLVGDVERYDGVVAHPGWTAFEVTPRPRSSSAQRSERTTWARLCCA